MFCRNCGGNNPDNAKFCRHCGFLLLDASNETPSYSKTEDNARSISYSINALLVKAKDLSISPQYRPFFIAGAVLIVLLLMLILIHSISCSSCGKSESTFANNITPPYNNYYNDNGFSDPDPDDIMSNNYESTYTEPLVNEYNANSVGNTPSALINDGEFAYQDGWLYYAFDGSQIYKLPDGGNEYDVVKLSSDRGKYLNVVGEWLYYLVKDGDSYSADGEYLIKRIKIDGSSEEILSSGIKSHIFPMYVGDGYIFYTDTEETGTSSKNYIVRMNYDGTDKTTVAYGQLRSVNFEEESFIVESEDYSSLQAYSFDGGSTDAYDIAIEIHEEYMEETGGLICIYVTDIVDSSDMLITTSGRDIYVMPTDHVFLSDSEGYGYTLTEEARLSGFPFNPCYHDGMLYYIKATDEDGNEIDDRGIYTSVKGTETWIKSIYNAEDIWKMYVVGDGWIYYQEQTDYWYRCRTDGTDEEYISWMTY